MSKSRGNVIYADDLANLFGVDAVRYFVLHEMPFENDGTITWELMVERTNAELANVLGNLVNRTISMSNKYFDGVVKKTGVSEAVDEDLKNAAVSAGEKVDAKMKELRVADAISEVFALFKRCNKYIDETAPWVLAKEEDKKDRLSEVLYNLTEAILIGASLVQSFLPDTAKKIAGQFNTTLRSYDELGEFGLYESGKKVTDKPEILFARLDIKEVMPKVEAIQAAQRAEYEAEQEKIARNLGKDLKGEKTVDTAKTEEETFLVGEHKEEIEYPDFDKCEFRVGEIVKCEEVKKSKKLLCSQVKVGDKTVQILSGIKAYYSPEEMVGKKVMVLLNLKPVTMAGLVSEGMLLCAEDKDGNLALMTPEKDLHAGSEIC